METKTVKPTELSALPTGPILVVLEFLSLRALSRALRVSREWQSLVDTHDHLWTAQFSVYAAGREYVVPALAELSRGERAVLQSEADAVAALGRLRVKALKQIIRSEYIRVQPGTLVEKRDFVDAIVAARNRVLEVSSDRVLRLTQRPRLLIGDGNELYSKAAVRLAKLDETRTRIAISELTSFTFHIRVRSDGPMGEITHMDPWYSNRGHGEARFADDFTVTFNWPTVDGVEMNPFAQMGMSNPLTLRWAIEHDGAVIRILFGAQRGPQEMVCRHPVHGGWVLYSMGSVWTSWEMPACGADGRCVDALLWDDELHNLPCAYRHSV